MEYALSDTEALVLKRLSSQCCEANQKIIAKLCEAKRVTAFDIDSLGMEDADTVPLFVFFSTLKPVPRKAEEYKCSAAFAEKTRLLKLAQANREYKDIVRSVDAAQKYGQTHLMDGFGAEVATMNKQMMTIFNVLLTVVSGFFFGFTGVLYIFPGYNFQLAERFMFGLVCGTIIFFADLYFVVKNMDEISGVAQRDVPTKSDEPRKVIRTVVAGGDEKPSPTEETHEPKTTPESTNVKKRKKPAKAN